MCQPGLGAREEGKEGEEESEGGREGRDQHGLQRALSWEAGDVDVGDLSRAQGSVGESTPRTDQPARGARRDLPGWWHRGFPWKVSCLRKAQEGACPG